MFVSIILNATNLRRLALTLSVLQTQLQTSREKAMREQERATIYFHSMQYQSSFGSP